MKALFALFIQDLTSFEESVLNHAAHTSDLAPEYYFFGSLKLHKGWKKKVFYRRPVKGGVREVVKEIVGKLLRGRHQLTASQTAQRGMASMSKKNSLHYVQAFFF